MHQAGQRHLPIRCRQFSTDKGEQKRADYRERELATRETDLLGKLKTINTTVLDIGGEFGSASLAKAHIAKVSQLEALLARRAEVAATLEAMRAKTSLGAADMGDVEIKRATLLDRGLADLTFDKAKREAELVNLQRRYTEASPKIKQKRQEISVIDAAIVARREQIAVLGRTGALTDSESADADETTAEIEALLQKVSKQIETVRLDAKALNGKRIELDFLQEEREETRRMLDETRRALDVIRLESRNALPGVVEVLSPAITPDVPMKDMRKMFGIAGTMGGGLGGMALFIILAASRKSIRFSDDLWRMTAQITLLRVLPSAKSRRQGEDPSHDFGHLCNAIQLLPVRDPGAVSGARIIAIGATDNAETGPVARALSESFAEREIATLLIDADLGEEGLTQSLGLAGQAGWRELLGGSLPAPTPGDPNQVVMLGAGARADIADHTVSARAVRAVLNGPATDFGVIVINLGSLGERMSSSLIVAASDLVIGLTCPGDASGRVERHLRRADDLARNGAAIVFCDASKRDPGLRAFPFIHEAYPAALKKFQHSSGVKRSQISPMASMS